MRDPSPQFDPDSREDLDRPEWLVGAEEGASSKEPTPEDAAEHHARSLSRMQRPDAAPAPRKAWTAAASSVPRLKLVSSAETAPRRPAPPVFTDPETEDDLEAPADDDSSPVHVVSVPRAPEPLHEPWWVIALDAIRTERRWQILLGALVVALIASFALRPHDSAHVSIRDIHRHPERFDGRMVTVAGRVGEVFSVGGGYAFNLHQGRDTIVVFTRSRVPETRTKVTIEGSISTGYLDGLPRQSLFEKL